MGCHTEPVRTLSRTRLVLAAAVVFAALGGIEHATADCVGPELEVQPSAVRPGERIVITGSGFLATCNDTASGGCFGSGEPAKNLPLRNIHIELVTRDLVAPLGVADAGDSFGWRQTVTLPADLQAGEVIVRAGVPNGASVDESIAVLPPQ